MRKRILAGAVSLALALSFLAPCAFAAAEPEYVLERKTVPMRIQTTAQEEIRDAADINLDGEFDPDDQLPDDINRYGLIREIGGPLQERRRTV